MIFEDLIEARLLVAMAGARSFAQAGRALGMPAATVTRRVAALETRAGLRLFDRTSRVTQATEAGRALIEHARRLVAETEHATMSMETLREEPRGWIRVTAPVMLGEVLLGPVIATFLEMNPESDVFLDLSPEASDLVADAFDVAIRTGPPGDGDLITRKVGQAGAALYRRTSCGSPVAQTPEELAGMPFGLLRRSGTKEDRLTLNDGTATPHIISVRPRLVSLNAQVLLQAALESDLIVVLPRMIAYPAVTSGKLRCEAPDFAAHSTDVSIIHTSRRLMRPIVRNFVDHVATELPPLLRKFEDQRS